MKRCPQCDFLYLDSDDFCDLDGSPLGGVETSNEVTVCETRAASIKKSWKTYAMIIVPGVVFGAVLLLVYNWVETQRKTLVSNEAPRLVIQPPPQRTEPSPIETAIPTPEASKSAVAKASPPKPAVTAPAQLSSKPVSTGTHEKRSMIIRLSDGGTIAADEAWRTKDGIWYRRNGVVTLLKRHQVKAIEKAP
jgi:hypothetical protein